MDAWGREGVGVGVGVKVARATTGVGESDAGSGVGTLHPANSPRPTNRRNRERIISASIHQNDR